MHWDNDLTGRPEDTVETEPPKEQPLPLTPEDPSAWSEDPIPHHHHVTEDTAYLDESPVLTEERTYVDADAEITEPEERSLDPYDILRDDTFALIHPEIVDSGTLSRTNSHPHTHDYNNPNPRTPQKQT